MCKQNNLFPDTDLQKSLPAGGEAPCAPSTIRLSWQLRTRTMTGQLGILIGVVVVVAVLFASVLTFDSARIHTVQQQLQKAVDQAAIAGAIDLFVAPDDAEAHAFATAAANFADARAVSPASPGTQVYVDVALPQGQDLGHVTVTARMEVQHMLMGILGRPADTLSADATAEPGPPATQLPENYPFPIAVSWDTVAKKEEAQQPTLSSLKIGDTWKIYIGSQQVKNGAFTSFLEPASSASYINAAIDTALGLTPPQPHLIPAIAVGDSIGLNNGILGQKRLADDPYMDALLAKPYLILPVITGDPAMNQERQIAGFVAVKVTDVEVKKDKESHGKKESGVVETITVQIVPLAIPGPGGGPPSPIPGSVSVLSIRLTE